MPATPLHLAGAWALYLATGRRGSFVAMSLGSVLVDLENPIYWALGADVYHARGILHSLLGALTLVPLITLVVHRRLMPPFWRWCMRRWPDPRTFRFAGRDVRGDQPSLAVLWLSAAAGGLSHAWLDFPNHSFNPVLWPYTADPLNLLPFSEVPVWEVGYHVAWFVILLALLRVHWEAWQPRSREAPTSAGA